MAQVKRLTPDQLFPEAEIATHGPPANYSAPYPLSEYFFLLSLIHISEPTRPY